MFPDIEKTIDKAYRFIIYTKTITCLLIVVKLHATNTYFKVSNCFNIYIFYTSNR